MNKKLELVDDNNVHRLSRQFDSGSGGGNNGGMELTERVIRVEEKLTGVDKRLELVEKDLRALGQKLDAHFYWMIGAMVALAGMMAKGFHWF